MATSPAPLSAPWLWNVVLLDDQEHTYDYVIRMLHDVFGHGQERALQIAQQVDAQGRAVCCCVHRELAELKLEQVAAYGRDPLMASCKGPMKAVMEPVVVSASAVTGPGAPGVSGPASAQMPPAPPMPPLPAPAPERRAVERREHRERQD